MDNKLERFASTETGTGSANAGALCLPTLAKLSEILRCASSLAAPRRLGRPLARFAQNDKKGNEVCVR